MRASLGVVRAGRGHGQRTRRGRARARQREDTASAVVLACVAAAGADAPQPASKDRNCRQAAMRGNAPECAVARASMHRSTHLYVDAGGFLPTEKLWFLPPLYQEPKSFLQEEFVSSIFALFLHHLGLV